MPPSTTALAAAAHGVDKIATAAKHREQRTAKYHRNGFSTVSINLALPSAMALGDVKHSTSEVARRPRRPTLLTLIPVPTLGISRDFPVFAPVGGNLDLCTRQAQVLMDAYLQSQVFLETILVAKARALPVSVPWRALRP